LIELLSLAVLCRLSLTTVTRYMLAYPLLILVNCSMSRTHKHTGAYDSDAEEVRPYHTITDLSSLTASWTSNYL